MFQFQFSRQSGMYRDYNEYRLRISPTSYIPLRPLTRITIKLRWNVNPVYREDKFGERTLHRWIHNVDQVSIGYGESDYSAKSKTIVRIQFNINEAAQVGTSTNPGGVVPRNSSYRAHVASACHIVGTSTNPVLHTCGTNSVNHRANPVRHQTIVRRIQHLTPRPTVRCHRSPFRISLLCSSPGWACCPAP